MELGSPHKLIKLGGRVQTEIPWGGAVYIIIFTFQFAPRRAAVQLPCASLALKRGWGGIKIVKIVDL